MGISQMQLVAGVISSAMFISSSFPMVYKAYKTKDLKSYSLGNIVLANLGNLVHWAYVSSLPFGPMWFLHGFNTLVTVMMLLWYWQYEGIAHSSA